MSYAIGIDLGGSSVKSVVVTREGRTLTQANLDFDPSVRMQWAENIRALVGRFQEEQGHAAAAIGLSAPGLAAKDGRSIAVMPGRLSGLEGLDWSQFLAPMISIPVPVLNDAHAALLGEAWLGAARGFQNAILLTLGTGVGGAILVDGRLLRGAYGKGGHLGHSCLDANGPPDICGMPGSLEMASATPPLARAAAGASRQPTRSLPRIATATRRRPRFG